MVAAVLLAAVAALVLLAGFGQHERSAATDRLFPRGGLSPQIAVVGIDASPAYQQADQQWTLQQLAALVRTIRSDHPAEILFDVPYSDDVDAGTRPADNPFFSLDNEFMKARDVVLAEHADTLTYPSGALPVEHTTPDNSNAEISAAVSGVDVIDPDDDGVVRQMPMLVRNGNALAPSAALAAFLHLRGEPLAVRVHPADIQTTTGEIPSDDAGRIRISYPHGLQWSGNNRTVLSAARVLHGLVPQKDLAGKAVLVGVTDSTLGLTWSTPLSSQTPDVVVQAAAINTLLAGDELRLAPIGDDVVAVALLALIVGYGSLRLRVVLTPLVYLSAASGYLGLVIVRFHQGSVMDLIVPETCAAVVFVGATVLRSAYELGTRRQVSQMFSEYVPAEVAQELLDQERFDDAMREQRLDVAVLFCDLRGFTPLAASLNPTAVRELLDVYYDVTCDIIHEHGGTVMQFVGDEVFAVFGAPLADPNPAYGAYQCARDMVAAVPLLAQKLDDRELPAIEFGIGVHFGEVIAAHVGGSKRRQYAVIGDTVNVGSRLCSQAGAGQVVFSEAVRDCLDTDEPCEALGVVPLKGVSRSINIFRVVAERSRTAQDLLE